MDPLRPPATVARAPALLPVLKRTGAEAAVNPAAVRNPAADPADLGEKKEAARAAPEKAEARARAPAGKAAAPVLSVLLRL